MTVCKLRRDDYTQDKVNTRRVIKNHAEEQILLCQAVSRVRRGQGDEKGVSKRYCERPFLDCGRVNPKM